MIIKQVFEGWKVTSDRGKDYGPYEDHETACDMADFIESIDSVEFSDAVYEEKLLS